MATERDDEHDEKTKDADASEGEETDRREDEESAESQESSASDSEESDDEPGDEDEGDEDDTGEGEQRILIGTPEENEVQEDLPRNRAERRLRKRQERRGQLNKPQDDSASPAASRRPRLPPRTVTGRNNADDVPLWARSAVNWMSKNALALTVGAAFVLLVAGGAVFWTWRHSNQLAKAATAYRDAIEIGVAPIRAADAPPEPAGAPPHTGPTFTDRTARSNAELRALRDVEHRYPNSPITPLAKLSEASTLYDLGRYAEARPIFEQLLHGDTAGQEARVLEGLGFTLEALNDNAGALTKYQELGRIDDGAHRDMALYHQARVEQRMGHNDRARDILHQLLERLRRSSTDEALGTGGTVLEEAQALLRDIAPDDPLAQVDRDPEALMRQLQQRFGNQVRIQRPGAGGAPAPSAPPAGGGGGGH